MDLQPNILIIDDESLIRWALSTRFAEAGYLTQEADSAAGGLKLLNGDVDLVLLDYKLPDSDGFDVLARIRELAPDTAVIMISGFSSVEGAVEAMKRGVYHYVSKPFDINEICDLAERALKETLAVRQLRAYRAQLEVPRIIGDSPAIVALTQLLARVARSPASTVLLTGESGTGKDLVARTIHHLSDRVSHPFMNITCSALTESLLESELFGHEKGAFTDARQMKKGLLELADGGTVFLDEIGEMTPGLQAKLLRFLEAKTFKRVGGSTDIQIDVRVIAATHRNLEEDVESGKFRRDLYYRLRVMPIDPPPLRERPGDIAALLSHYLDAFAREFKKKVRTVAPDLLHALEAYGWPGNIRELRNAVERAVLLSESEVLTTADLAFLTTPRSVTDGFRLPHGGLDFERLERDLVSQALEQTDGNQTRAGELLKMNRDQIRYRIEKFGLRPR